MRDGNHKEMGRESGANAGKQRNLWTFLSISTLVLLRSFKKYLSEADLQNIAENLRGN